MNSARAVTTMMIAVLPAMACLAAQNEAMAQEYRRKFPDKAVISGLDQAADVQP